MGMYFSEGVAKGGGGKFVLCCAVLVESMLRPSGGTSVSWSFFSAIQVALYDF